APNIAHGAAENRRHAERQGRTGGSRRRRHHRLGPVEELGEVLARIRPAALAAGDVTVTFGAIDPIVVTVRVLEPAAGLLGRHLGRRATQLVYERPRPGRGG